MPFKINHGNLLASSFKVAALSLMRSSSSAMWSTSVFRPPWWSSISVCFWHSWILSCWLLVRMIQLSGFQNVSMFIIHNGSNRNNRNRQVFVGTDFFFFNIRCYCSFCFYKITQNRTPLSLCHYSLTQGSQHGFVPCCWVMWRHVDIKTIKQQSRGRGGAKCAQRDCTYMSSPYLSRSTYWTWWREVWVTILSIFGLISPPLKFHQHYQVSPFCKIDINLLFPYKCSYRLGLSYAQDF